MRFDDTEGWLSVWHPASQRLRLHPDGEDLLSTLPSVKTFAVTQGDERSEDEPVTRSALRLADHYSDPPKEATGARIPDVQTRALAWPSASGLTAGRRKHITGW